MKKIKLLLLKIAEAPFSGIVHFVPFIYRFTCKSILYNVSELAFRIHCSLYDAEARVLGYKNFSDMMNDVLHRIAVDDTDDTDDPDEYDEDDTITEQETLRDRKCGISKEMNIINYIDAGYALTVGCGPKYFRAISSEIDNAIDDNTPGVCVKSALK